jgi:hypothetical protein
LRPGRLLMGIIAAGTGDIPGRKKITSIEFEGTTAGFQALGEMANILSKISRVSPRACEVLRRLTNEAFPSEAHAGFHASQ